jgi:hypothetical protein
MKNEKLSEKIIEVKKEIAQGKKITNLEIEKQTMKENERMRE